jgi:hypothetical protein
MEGVAGIVDAMTALAEGSKAMPVAGTTMFRVNAP